MQRASSWNYAPRAYAPRAYAIRPEERSGSAQSGRQPDAPTCRHVIITSPRAFLQSRVKRQGQRASDAGVVTPAMDISELQALLAGALEQKSTVRLSERNVVELVSLLRVR